LDRLAASHDSSGEHDRGFGIYRHKAKLADGIPDGIMSAAPQKFTLHQIVTTPGDY
jgi:hypothetical protein